MTLSSFDIGVIEKIKIATLPLARMGLFIIFFWFGLLKVINASPADALVAALLEIIFPSVSFESFRLFFGFYEMIIGAAFIIPRAERIGIALLVPHMIATFLPLILLPDITWQGVLTPSFEGQYIIKNLIIIALALAISAQLRPIKSLD